MDKSMKLTMLKKDLQILTDANDEYLKILLESSKAAIIREGIVIPEEESIEIGMAVVQYAAYLYRKRAGTDTSMPRYLRYALNNILFSQKAGKAVKEDDDT